MIKQVPEAKLLIVGDGTQRPKLEGIIAKLSLQNHVIMTGFQPYQEMPQYINLAAVCINPFLVTNATRDIFPAKILQYMACGKATVATPLLGITTLVPGQSLGVIYANSADEMAREVVSLLKSADNRQQLEYAGVSYIRQRHSHEKIALQLETILEEVANDKRDQAISKRV